MKKSLILSGLLFCSLLFMSGDVQARQVDPGFSKGNPKPPVQQNYNRMPKQQNHTRHNVQPKPIHNTYVTNYYAPQRPPMQRPYRPYYNHSLIGLNLNVGSFMFSVGI